MDLANLKVKIGADTNDLDAGLNKANRSLVQFGNKASTVANKGRADFTSLSRVIQDLPYGFNGIANNLTQLIPGVGMLGLAFSGLVSAITFAQVGFGAWTRGLGGSKKSMQETGEAVSEYRKEIQRANEEIGKHFSQVSQLVLASQSQNVTYKEQEAIVKKLKEINREYFADLRIENGIIVGLTDSYRNYARALADMAKAKVNQGQIAKLSADLVGVTGQLDGVNSQLTTLGGRNAFFPKGAEELDGILKKVLITYEDTLRISQLTGLSEKRVNELLEARGYYIMKQAGLYRQIESLGASTVQATLDGLKETTEKTKTYQDVIADLRQEVAGLQAQFQNGFITSIQLDQKTIDAYQKAVQKLGEIKAPPLVIRDIAFEIAPERVREAMRELGKFIEKNMKEDPIQAPGDVKPVVMLTEEQAKLNNQGKKIIDWLNTLDEYAKKMKTIGDAIVANFAQPLQQAFQQIFEGQNAIQSLGNMVKNLVIRLVSAAAAAAVLSTILSAVGLGGKGSPFNFKSLFASLSGLPKFARGGMVTGPTLSMVGDNPSGKEAIIPFERMGEFINGLSGVGGREPYILKTEISGQNLALVLERATAARGRYY